MLQSDWLKTGTYSCFVWLNQNLLLEDEPDGVFLFSHSARVPEVHIYFYADISKINDTRTVVDRS